MATISAQQFLGTGTAKVLGNESEILRQNKPAEQPGYFERLMSDINTRADRVGNILNRPDSSVLEKGVQTFGQGAGMAANVIEKTAEQIPGVKQVFGAVGSAINWLATSENSPIKHLGDVIGSSKGLQEITTLYDTDQNFKDSVDAVANTARLGGDVQMVADAVNFTKNVVNKITPKLKGAIETTGETLSKTGGKIKDYVVPESSEIMNRVARLKPTDATKFERLAGKTHGEYLTETGNFGAPDKIINNEAVKFATSKASVDAELAKIAGTYKNGAVTDAIEGLVKKAKATSSGNVKSPFLNDSLRLQAKNASEGLTMEEINAVKRLYERQVKLGYNKLLNPNEVELATNIDNSLRNFQVKAANDAGFTNISELNKQTQLSKFIIDKLGDQIVGKTGLNNIGLTDWIVLSGGDPSSVAGFLTKKFFSSKGIQAKIAEWLNKGDVKGMITPEVAERLGLPAPKEGSAKFQINKPIELPKETASTIEAREIKKFGKSNVSETNPLLQEAKKYGSAEEFVKAQSLYHGTSADIQGGKLSFGAGDIRKGGQSGGLFLSDTPESAQVFGKTVYQASPEIKTQVIDLTKPEGIKTIENYIGKTYKTYDGETVKFTRQDFESMFPNGKTDFASISQFPELVDKIVTGSGKRGIAFNEYAGGKIGKTYQILNGDIPIKTKSQLTDIWNEANKK